MIVDLVLLFLVLLVAITIVVTKNLVHAVIYGGLFSLLSALLYLVMAAPDVALTEAAIGACITICLFLAVLRIIKTESGHVDNRNWFLMGACIIFFGVIAVSSIDLHNYGDMNAITNKGIVDYYKLHFAEDAGLLSMVNVILSSYRGFDTFGETLVIFIAGMCVWLIVGKDNFVKSKTDEK
jgi:multicomponent Na+:H+ antiporter subunit B